MSFVRRSLLITVSLVALASGACMKNSGGKVAGVAMAAGPGLRGEILFELGMLEKKVMSLLEAIPQDKMGYKPADDMRTTAGIFVHLGNAPFFFASMIGAAERPTPARMKEAGEAEKTLTDKAAIKAHLEKAFGFQKKAIEGFSDGAMDDMVKTPWGMKMSKRSFLGYFPKHLHSHLGQLGVYARVSGITPPWVAKEKAMREKVMKKMMEKMGKDAAPAK